MGNHTKDENKEQEIDEGEFSWLDGKLISIVHLYAMQEVE